jgi:hypothetical protein
VEKGTTENGSRTSTKRNSWVINEKNTFFGWAVREYRYLDISVLVGYRK